MSEIARDLGNYEDSLLYRVGTTKITSLFWMLSIGTDTLSICFQQRADSIRDKFLELAVSNDGTHLLASYGNQSSWMTHVSSIFRLS